MIDILHLITCLIAMELAAFIEPLLCSYRRTFLSLSFSSEGLLQGVGKEKELYCTNLYT